MADEEGVLTLEQALSDEEPEKVEPEETGAEAEAEQETVEAEAEEKPDEPSQEDSPPESKDEPWHLKAVLDEREKRQRLERQLEELQKQIPQEQREPTSFFDDEGRARQEMADEIRVEFLQRELKRSERNAVRDFGEETVQQATEWFNEKALRYPSLLERFHDSFNDVGEVVKMYQENQQFAGMKDVDKLRAELKAEILAEMQSSQQDRQSEVENKRDSITPSLATQTSAGSDKESVKEIGLEDIWES